ncbi:histidine kinase dimerization/phospho-acceptor domain-containing protein [Nonomuraea sp. NPDC049309]|uniref:histidine kinase dimerization/phospho-acceptor domain-containing protein n=1 Tax=Nonomuraea sp. NPDC049309 TaxID=3364350 RepID=UPI003722BCA1
MTAPPGPYVRDRPLSEEMRRLGADAGHALRTPVTALRVELEEARLHPDQVDLDALLGRAIDAVTRLEHVIEQLRLPADPSPGVVYGCRFGEHLRGSHPR